MVYTTGDGLNRARVDSLKKEGRVLTDVYFVRHCQSQKGWKEGDSTRPLTARGTSDSEAVTIALRGIPLDYCVCSPYIRSINTIRGAAEEHGLEIHTDARFGERIGGKDSSDDALQRRWADHDYAEEGGECIRSVKERNIEALGEVLSAHAGESILLGTHGTALSAILDYYESDFGLAGFLRLYFFMPYVIHAVFDGTDMVMREDILILNRGY